ncbi:MAG TPA: FAD-dependent monooxygenase [Candidatus Dormibacteraeota bacterium]|nr:FAD-dependent monooxygenase [Candidatus Dormibacteraeota bacterium]
MGALYSPRRTILDALLVDAAREAGAEVRERFTVEEVPLQDDRVVGVHGRERGGHPVREPARLVVGADGRHSVVARAVRAPAYHVRPPLSIAYHTCWSGVPVQGGEIYGRDRRLIGAWPTNDGLVVTYVAAPPDEFGAFRTDPEGSLLRSLDAAGDLGERVRVGVRAERVLGTADLHNRFHRPHGPGWALVGDAGLRLDPVTGQGIADVFRDAELLAEAVATGLDGGPPLTITLDGYRARRDAAALPMYELTPRSGLVRPSPAGAAAAVRGAGGPSGGDRPLPRGPERDRPHPGLLQPSQPAPPAGTAADAEARPRRAENGGIGMGQPDDATPVRRARSGDPADPGLLFERPRPR